MHHGEDPERLCIQRRRRSLLGDEGGVALSPPGRLAAPALHLLEQFRQPLWEDIWESSQLRQAPAIKLWRRWVHPRECMAQALACQGRGEDRHPVHVVAALAEELRRIRLRRPHNCG